LCKLSKLQNILCRKIIYWEVFIKIILNLVLKLGTMKVIILKREKQNIDFFIPNYIYIFAHDVQLCT